jgi:hypothetical protein
MPKQPRKKSALTLAPRFGALIEKCALLLSFFYFKAGADKLVNLIWDEQVTALPVPPTLGGRIGSPGSTARALFFFPARGP